MSDPRTKLSRRHWLGAVTGAALSALLPTRSAHALMEDPFQGLTTYMPACFTAHGGPNLARDPIIGPRMRAWGERLPRPAGIVVVTPHFRARQLTLGAVGPGHALYSFPRRFLRGIEGLDYPCPTNVELVGRVQALLETQGPVTRSGRAGLDHTSWMPLMHLFPEADVPVLEVAMPFLPDRQLFEFGALLGTLRREGVLILTSGNVTHNLAALGSRETPGFARDFDAWVAERAAAGDVDALLDWRARAPAPYLAHPDDGGHYDVLLIALGAATAGGLAAPSFPLDGFVAGSVSLRCLQYGG